MSVFPPLLVALLVLALLMRLDFVFYIVYVVGGIYLLARWWTPRGLRRLQVTRRLVDHAFLGERIAISVEVANTARLALPWLRLNETLPSGLSSLSQIKRVATVRGRETVAIDYELSCTHRGYYPIGPLRLSAGDLFGFSEVEGREEARQYLTVYPRIVPLTSLALPSRLPHGSLAASRRNFEDPARLRGVREYQPGDTIRRIHWKASAHSDSLLVKQFSPAKSLESMVLLNLNRSDYHRQRIYTASEWAIVVAASVATHLVGVRQAVGLAANGTDPLVVREDDFGAAAPGPSQSIAPRPGRPHLMKILETLARIEASDQEEPFVHWAQRAAISLSWGATVLVVTPLADDALCQGLHGLVRAGMNVVMLVTEPYANFAVVRERARRLGMSAFPVASETDLSRLQARAPGRRKAAA